MSVNITIEGKEKLAVVGNVLLARRKIIDEHVRKSMLDFGQRLVGRSKKDYLSGPRPAKLGTVTDRLRSSITALVEDVSQHRFQLRFGTNVWYGRIHELGLDRVSSRGKTYPTRKRPFLSTAWADEFPGFKGRLIELLMSLNARFDKNVE